MEVLAAQGQLICIINPFKNGYQIQWNRRMTYMTVLTLYVIQSLSTLYKIIDFPKIVFKDHWLVCYCCFYDFALVKQYTSMF